MDMKQLSLATTGFEPSTKSTRKCKFLAQIDAVILKWTPNLRQLFKWDTV